MIGNIRFRDFWLGTIAWSTMEMLVREIVGARTYGDVLADKWFPNYVYFVFIFVNIATITWVACKKENVQM